MNVGDLVAWIDAPNGLLREHDGCFCVRRDGCGRMVWDPSAKTSSSLGWDWLSATDQAPVTIVVPILTGLETDEDLRRMAEIFEVREMLTATFIERQGKHEPAFWLIGLPTETAELIDHSTDDGRAATQVGDGFEREAALDETARRLHALGFRKGMKACSAAQLIEAATNEVV